MVSPLRIVLFVEGSPTRHPRLADLFENIWRTPIVEMLQLPHFDRIVTIDKRMIAAMDPATKISGRAVPLPDKLAAELERSAFDVAVIAWDLLPPWEPEQVTCRWNETLNLYKGFSASQSLPEPWRTRAAARLKELNARRVPSDRLRKQSLTKCEILAVCMEPTFESLLTHCEKTIRNIFGITDARAIGWPNWNDPNVNPTELLGLSIEAARKIHPQPVVFRHIRGDMKTAKNEWGECLLRQMIRDEQCFEKLKRHPTSLRFTEILARGRVR